MKKNHLIAFIILTVVQLILLAIFYNRFWCPADEGLFAHTAERMLDGERLFLDVEEAHPGYIHWINALAMKTFGRDLVSLRYPLMVIALIQAWLIFFILFKRDIVTALWAGLSLTVLGVLHFLNPNHHWYAMFFAVVLAWYLSRNGPATARRYFIAGILVATIYMFRQLTGVFVGMAAVSYFLYEISMPKNRGKNKLCWSDLVWGSIFFVLLVYLYRKTDLVSFILFGLPPVMVLIWLFNNRTVENRKAAGLLKYFVSGGLAGFIPIVLYQFFQGSLGLWFENTVVRAIRVYGQDFLSQQNYGFFFQTAVTNMFPPTTAGAAFNGLYFVFLMLIPLTAGVVGIYCLQRAGKSDPRLFALFFVSVFYGVVSLHFQIPVYIYFSAGLTAAGLLSLLTVREWPARVKYAVQSVFVLLFTVGICCHAAQSLYRPLDWVFRGKVMPFVYAGNELPRVNLWIDPASLVEYRKITRIIAERTGEGESILVLPYNPELYFISRRRNVLSFPIPDYQSEEDLARILERLGAAKPSLLVYAPFDKRVTPLTARIVNHIKGDYQLIEKTVEFHVYERIE